MATMFCRTSPMIRNAAVQSCKTPQASFAPIVAASYSTSCTSRRQPTASRPSSITTRHCTAQWPRQQHRQSIVFPVRSVRHASTTTTTPDPTAPTSPSTSAEAETLTWNRFLALRKTRRRIGLVCSIFGAIGMTGVGATVVSSYDLDQWAKATFGLDEIVSTGLLCLGFTGVGWLLGPSVGSGVFGLMYRRLGSQIAVVSWC